MLGLQQAGGDCSVQPVWQNLLSTLAGGLIAIGAWVVQDQVATRRRRRSLRSALAAEIASLVELTRRQRYADELRQFAGALTSAAPGTEGTTLTVPVRQAYFTVFESNASTIGELPPDVATGVVRFYQGARSLLDALSDQRPKEVHIYAGERAARYLELAGGVEELCKLGDEIAGKLRSTT